MRPQENVPQIIVFVSILLSPMAYLVYGHPELLVGLTHLYGFVFLCGTIDLYTPFSLGNPLGSSNADAFLFLAIFWILTGIYLVFNTPCRLSKGMTIIGHLVALVLQITVPFILFLDYVLVIPFPIPSVIAIVVLILNEKERIHQ